MCNIINLHKNRHITIIINDSCESASRFVADISCFRTLLKLSVTR